MFMTSLFMGLSVFCKCVCLWVCVSACFVFHVCLVSVCLFVYFKFECVNVYS